MNFGSNNCDVVQQMIRDVTTTETNDTGHLAGFKYYCGLLVLVSNWFMVVNQQGKDY